jgi:anti-sigma factor (TIGR02949 family)
MQCAEALRVQAYFDGEVDALSAAEIERHAEHCGECRALLQDLQTVREALRRNISYAAAPAVLRAQILGALDQEASNQPAEAANSSAEPASRPAESANRAAEAIAPTAARGGRPFARQTRPRGRLFWTGAFSGIGGAAIAAAMAFFLVLPAMVSPLANDLTSAHVRSLMPDHLIDVVSTDKHTVKPWFAGHADVSPVVADFDSQGYRLIGGRADYIDHQRSAVIVYRHGAHVINVFTWAVTNRHTLSNTTRNGYHLAFWQQGDIQYCAVSDTGWDELLGLVRLMREQT